jgi:DNA invertase Pin-like site-specific DNA recombinase
VLQHGESTQPQYGLAERARALGWTPESIEIIDEDQGKSGSSTDGRDGFARLVDGVAHGEVGAILATEVSRLARCSEDWQRLMEGKPKGGVVDSASFQPVPEGFL